MGIYLNSLAAYTLYKNESKKTYFVDKTSILEELFPLVEEGNHYICITRPRRFGKTVTANLIASFFSKGCDASDVFDRLKVSGNQEYRRKMNQYNVIHISLNEVPKRCVTYEQYIQRIEARLIKDLKQAYPDADVNEEDAVWDVLMDVYAADKSARFIFVLDEWDYIFHRDFVSREDKEAYIEFLSSLLKDKPYVVLAYMTGILPITKYSSGSALNMFLEYTMAEKEKYSQYLGFDDREVDELYARYLAVTSMPAIEREGLRVWYDGYHTLTGKRLYNPRSVVSALSDNQLGSYWTNAGPYDEIFYYIEKNVDAVRDDLARMAAGEGVKAKIQEYAATSMNLQTKDEILSAMVVYGFLSYEDGKVRIPNKELMDKFADVLLKEPSLGYVHRLARESERMLEATLGGDSNKVAEILEFAHNTEIPLLNYNNETDLTALVNLLYLSARDSYHVEREDKAGIGYVDFIFYPKVKNEPGIILELKVDSTPEEAIHQIRERGYMLNFKRRIGGRPEYTGKVLGVGIAYDRKSKKHSCKIEVL